MHIDLNIYGSTEYFEQTGREIDWDEDKTCEITTAQSDLIDKIISLEVAIQALRHTTGICGLQIDTLSSMKIKLKDEYEESYEPYVQYNEYD